MCRQSVLECPLEHNKNQRPRLRIILHTFEIKKVPVKSKQKAGLKGDLATERIQSPEASVPPIQHRVINFPAKNSHRSIAPAKSESLSGAHFEREDRRPLLSPLPQSPIDFGQTQFTLPKPLTTEELSPGFLLWPISTNLLGVGGRQWEERTQESLMLLSAGVIESNLQKTNIKRFLSQSIKKKKKSKTRRVNLLPTVTTIDLKCVCLPLMPGFPGSFRLPGRRPCSFCLCQPRATGRGGMAARGATNGKQPC